MFYMTVCKTQMNSWPDTEVLALAFPLGPPCQPLPLPPSCAPHPSPLHLPDHYKGLKLAINLVHEK